MTLDSLYSDFNGLANPTKAQLFKRFFKTGPGQYGEGDEFLGLTVPQTRSLVTKYWRDLSFADLDELLKSPIHEHRTLALAVMNKKFNQFPELQPKIYQFYLDHTTRINNWDLVDISCPTIVGQYLLNRDRKILYQLAKSNLLWDRRISIISTFTFIRHRQFDDTLKISQILLTDKNDLIHKAVGWMLREVGKQDLNTLIAFLDQNTLKMPRTALRYAIEKFPESKRKYYLELR